MTSYDMTALFVLILGGATLFGLVIWGNSLGTDSEPSPLLIEAKWSQLDDGSRFARVASEDGAAEMALRCWTSTGQGHTCLRAYRQDMSGFRSVTVDREIVTELAPRIFPYSSTINGYSCGRIIGDVETITRAGQTLESNMPPRDGGPWSKAFVARYMKRNRVGGSGWFPCLDVLRNVTSGSLETLGTTSITRRSLGG
ncbi:MAG: hypothetical protein SFV23_05370 [Planctomycetaceae bacterium]|nr:hypothetical protein [Planctomycetaceae bacterium]